MFNIGRGHHKLEERHNQEHKQEEDCIQQGQQQQGLHKQEQHRQVVQHRLLVVLGRSLPLHGGGGGDGIPHGGYEDQANNFTPQTFYRLPMDPDHREQSRLPNSEPLHETRVPLPVVHVPPPLDDNRISSFHPHNNFGRPHDPSESKNQLGLYSTDYRQNGFASRNSSGYLSDRLGSRNSSGYLSDRSYESDRELERQNGFFMVMSDDIVSHNPDYYYYGNNGLEFSEFPASLGHDLPSIADLNTNNNNNKKT